MRVGDLIGGTRIWVHVEVQSVTAKGRLNPRLVLALRLTTPTDRIEAELRDVRLQLVFENEVLGEGRLTGEPALSYGSTCMVEVPLTHRTIDYVTSRLGRDDGIGLRLQWYGLLRVKWEPDKRDSRRAGEPEPGIWTDYHLPTLQHDHQLTIPRSDWFAHVLQPIRDDQFRYLEVWIPRGEEANRWSAALKHLESAERAYALGDDAAVFQHLRALFEALPGAPKQIVDALPESKRQAVDDLFRAVVSYLHHGRHVTRLGTDAGAFPVDHQDADSAISLAKVMISYLSRALSTARPSAG